MFGDGTGKPVSLSSALEVNFAVCAFRKYVINFPLTNQFLPDTDVDLIIDIFR